MKNVTIAIILIIIVVIGGIIYSRTTKQDVTRNIDMISNGTTTDVVSSEVSYFDSARGWYAEPVEAGEYPGIIVIHEWWGLIEQIKEAAEELARNGYKVLAVDLYEGKVATSSDDARAFSGAIDQARATNNMKAAAQYLETRGITKIASLGWCFGGGQSLQLSLSDLELDATIIYYGRLATERNVLAEVDEPVLGIFGAEDTSIPTTTVRQFESTLDSLNIPNEIYIYPNVGHAFANPSGMNYSPEATMDAWEKTISFLDRNLKQATTTPVSI